jgi:hypothetical protein
MSLKRLKKIFRILFLARRSLQPKSLEATKEANKFDDEEKLS